MWAVFTASGESSRCRTKGIDMGAMEPGPPPRAATESLTCPSSDGAIGNLLIGIVCSDGTVAATRPPLGIDDDFVKKASVSSDQPPETRFRFAGPCVTTACQQWAGTRCAIGDLVANASTTTAGHLPPCDIRPTCRWWSQNGPAACRSCALVVHTPPKPFARTDGCPPSTRAPSF